MENISDTEVMPVPVLCPSCLEKFEFFLPVDYLFPLEIAAAMIPMTYGALRSYLVDHKEDFPRRYRIMFQGTRRVLRRMLTASEIRKIRISLMRFKNVDLTPRQPTKWAD